MSKDTPAANWRTEGRPDPHGDSYDCKRSELARGQLTDDEMANEVFMQPHIGNLQAAKDRIRWLSRKTENLQSGLDQLVIAAERILAKLESDDQWVNTFDQIQLERALANAKQQEKGNDK